MSNLPTRESKIVKYRCEEDCVNLKQQNLSYREIAEELNNSGKVPKADPIDKYTVKRFLDKIPTLKKDIVKQNKHRLLQVVNTSFDIVNEINVLFGKTKSLLDVMEQDATGKGRYVNPYQYKAIVSEMREMLKQMTDIQKEINDYENIRKFMDIVLTTLYEEVPDKIPIIAHRLKLAKGTQWFASLVEEKRMQGGI